MQAHILLTELLGLGSHGNMQYNSSVNVLLFFSFLYVVISEQMSPTWTTGRSWSSPKSNDDFSDHDANAHRLVCLSMKQSERQPGQEEMTPRNLSCRSSDITPSVEGRNPMLLFAFISTGEQQVPWLWSECSYRLVCVCEFNRQVEESVRWWWCGGGLHGYL